MKISCTWCCRDRPTKPRAGTANLWGNEWLCDECAEKDEGAGITPPPPIHISQGDASDTLHHRPCKRCGHPVVVEADRYDVFEQMHWSCFHYEYEHDVDRDPDDPCGDVCPARLPDEAYARECDAHEDTIAKLRAARDARNQWVEHYKRLCEKAQAVVDAQDAETREAHRGNVGKPSEHRFRTIKALRKHLAQFGQDQR